MEVIAPGCEFDVFFYARIFDRLAILFSFYHINSIGDPLC